MCNTDHKIYGVYDINTRQYYEDDGGGRETTETLLDADTDVAALRERFNAYFAQPRIIDFQRNNRYVIASDAMESNTGSGSGGGCYASHRFVIRELPRLTPVLSALCAQCGQPMNVPGDLATTNCGGDCVRCMAEAGDPECLQAMQQLAKKQAECGLPNNNLR